MPEAETPGSRSVISLTRRNGARCGTNSSTTHVRLTKRRYLVGLFRFDRRPAIGPGADAFLAGSAARAATFLAPADPAALLPGAGDAFLTGAACTFLAGAACTFLAGAACTCLDADTGADLFAGAALLEGALALAGRATAAFLAGSAVAFLAGAAA